MFDPVKTGAGRLRPVEILRVKDDQSAVVRFLGGYSGTLLHFLGNKYTPCRAPERDCPASIHTKTKLWRGWAPAEVFDDVQQVWWPWVFEITECLEEQLRGRQLRGEVWGITRPKEKAKGNRVVGVFVERQPSEAIRKPFDIMPVLLRAYHLDEMPMGKPNTIPPKLILGPAEGELPAALVVELPEPVAPPGPEEKKKLQELIASLGGRPSRNGSAKPSEKGGAHRG